MILEQYSAGYLQTAEEIAVVEALRTTSPLPGEPDLYREHLDQLLASRVAGKALHAKAVEQVRLELARREHIERQGLGAFDEIRESDTERLEAPAIGGERYEIPDAPTHQSPYSVKTWKGNRGGGERKLYVLGDPDGRNRLVFEDRGDRLVFADRESAREEKEQAIREMLKVAVAKWPGDGALVILGHDLEFRLLVVRIAAEEGLSVHLADQGLAAVGAAAVAKRSAVPPVGDELNDEAKKRRPRRFGA